MKQIVTQAIVLNRTNFQEADRIITVITPVGKRSLLAKGVRKVQSKLAGGIELFSVCELTYLEGKSDLQTLISSRLVSHYQHIVADLDRTMVGYRLLKLINGITEADVSPDYFQLVVQALEILDNTTIDIALVEVWFASSLLSLEGLDINVATDSQGNTLDKDSTYSFDYHVMAFARRRNGQYSARHIKLLRLMKSIKKPLQLAMLTGIKQETKELQVLLKTILSRTYGRMAV